MTGPRCAPPSRPTPSARPSRVTSPAAGASRANGATHHAHRHGHRHRRRPGRGRRGLHRRRRPPGTRPPAPRRGPTPCIQHGVGSTRPSASARSTTAPTSARPPTPRRQRHLPVHASSGRSCPPTPATNDTVAVELGLRFTPDGRRLSSPGSASTRAPATPGRTPARLWNAPAPQLATVTFTNETATGWQTADFGTPVPVTRGHHLRRVLLRPQRALRGRRERLRLRQRQRRRRCTVAGGFGAPGGRRLRRLRARFPTETLRQRQLLRRPDRSATDGHLAAHRDRQHPWTRADERAHDDHGRAATFSRAGDGGLGGDHAQERQRRDGRRARRLRRGDRRPSPSPRPRRWPAASTLHRHRRRARTPQGIRSAATHLVVHHGEAAGPGRGVPVHAVQRRAPARRVLEENDPDAVTLGVRFTVDTPGTDHRRSASTRPRATPARTPARCGPRTAPSSPPARSPTSRTRAGRS